MSEERVIQKAKTGRILVEEGIELSYTEYGSGGKYLLSAQVGFAPKGMQQKLAEMG